ncbi:YadA family autotransporter adhesin [Sphingomonas sp. R86521]|uniref:YadA family autotransporter adhesin n=1 Tax=Sphingomonas sp. R86521 TaxID=3093860 RepID=UPI0036D2FDE1
MSEFIVDPVVYLPSTSTSTRARLGAGASLAGLAAAAALLTPGAGFAQVAPPPNIVGACSGVSLPRSVVTDIMSSVVTGVVAPIQNTVNPILGVVGGVLPLVPPLSIDAAGLLANAAAGNPITLQVLNANGVVVGAADRCDTQADSFTLRTPAGIAIGGNRITGLGATGQEAFAGEASSIAFGNAALTDATAVGSIALGARSGVGAGATGAVALGTGAQSTGVNGVALGAGSVAARGPQAGYTVLGLAAPQNSAGEVSIGAAGAERQLTNVAAGLAATDAVNVGQLAGVAAQVGAVAGTAVLYDSVAHDRVTLTGPAGTTLANLAPGTLGATSTEAVNGSQLFATNGNVTNLTTNVTNGAIGPVRYANAGTPTVPNGGVVSNDVTLVGAAAAPVGIHNVAAGVLGAGSTDAVNGGQLAGLGTSIANSYGGLTTYNPTTNSLAASIAYGGAQYTTLQSVFDQVNTSVNGGAGIRYFRVLSTRPDATVSGTDSIAIGPEANAVAGNSVALGAGAAAVRGATTGYAALGLAGLQNAIGEVSIGAPGAERQLTNVAAGVAASDAATVGQVAGVAAQVGALSDASVKYDGTTRDRVTLAGAGGTTITNVAAGALSPTSTDAVNGSQLNATNVQVANNTTAITNLGNTVANGAVGPVQFSNPGTPTTPNGGVRTNDLTLVGAAAAPVVLHNVGNGLIQAGSTDAVNGGQIAGLAQVTANAVTYNSVNGVRTNVVTLVGGNAAAPVAINNVAAGTLAANSTDAVNGAQLYATNQTVTTVQNTANTALTLGQNAVQYDSGRSGVTINPGGSAIPLHNVAAGTSPMDAVNVMQLGTGINSAVAQSNNYTDSRVSALNFDLRQVRRDANAGTANALAAAGLPQAYEAGKGMIAIGGGTYRTGSAVALGFSKAFNDGHTVVKLAGSYDSRDTVGASGGIGYQF